MLFIILHRIYKLRFKEELSHLYIVGAANVVYSNSLKQMEKDENKKILTTLSNNSTSHSPTIMLSAANYRGKKTYYFLILLVISISILRDVLTALLHK